MNKCASMKLDVNLPKKKVSSTVDHDDASAVFDFEDELLYEKCINMRSVTLQFLPKRLFSKL